MRSGSKYQPIKVKRAVIAAAGLGTRLLPYTKSVPKEMLPIVNKPVIQIVVEDLVAAGVSEIIIVTNDSKKAIEDHFDHNRALASEAATQGQSDIVKDLVNLTQSTQFIYLRQKGSPGNARPLMNASFLLANEPFFYYFADDFFQGQESAAQQLLAAFQATKASLAALFRPNRKLLNRYGVIDVESSRDRLVKIRKIVEKPSLSKAPSSLAVGGGYLFTPDVLPLLDQLKPRANGEIAISDAVAQLPTAYGLEIEGDYYDTGTPESYLASLVKLALKDPNTTI